MADLFMERDAVLSPDNLYRYLLRRSWDHTKPRALIVMLNPSTADATIDDATIRSCIRLFRDLSFGSFEVVNLFSWRATDPADLVKAANRIGPDQERVTYAAIQRCDVAVCAWGAHPLASNGHFLVQHIREYKPEVYCFGKTKAGSPRHPLYIKTGTQLEAYRP